MSMSVWVVLALMDACYGIYMTLEAVRSKNYLMGIAGSITSLWAGLYFGKLIWG